MLSLTIYLQTEYKFIFLNSPQIFLNCNQPDMFAFFFSFFIFNLDPKKLLKKTLLYKVQPPSRKQHYLGYGQDSIRLLVLLFIGKLNNLFCDYRDSLEASRRDENLVIIAIADEEESLVEREYAECSSTADATASMCRTLTLIVSFHLNWL